MAENTPTREVVWHLEDGTPTTDKSAAVSAEVTSTYADGRVEHTILRRKDTAGSTI